MTKKRCWGHRFLAASPAFTLAEPPCEHWCVLRPPRFACAAAPVCVCRLGKRSLGRSVGVPFRMVVAVLRLPGLCFAPVGVVLEAPPRNPAT